MTDQALANTPDWAVNSVNLASKRLGAKSIFATDEFFAPLERVMEDDPAQFIPGKYDDNGKWMDGWESRRRRSGGHDYGIIKLGRPGTIKGFDVDTSHFTGNYAPAISIEGTLTDKDDVDHLKKAKWMPILLSSSLNGNSHHYLKSISEESEFSHLRVNIYPDGGIARLRAYGQPKFVNHQPDADGLCDLVAMENGGMPIAWNDAHFGKVSNILLPGNSLNMGDGWETRRRREPGSDWCILALGVPGIVKKIEVYTTYFKGNFPDRCSIQADFVDGGTNNSLITQSMFWDSLLPEVKLSMDNRHVFTEQLLLDRPITHVRLNLFPDGGIARLRLWGVPERIR